MSKQRLQRLASIYPKPTSNDFGYVVELRREQLIERIQKPKLPQIKLLREYTEKTRRYMGVESIINESNPNNAYPIKTVFKDSNQTVWSCKYKNDHEMRMVLRLISKDVYEFLFSFEESKTYSSQEYRPEGQNYIDTVDKSVRDYVLPFVDKKPVGTFLYFNCYNDDGKGQIRKRAFTGLIDKYIDKSKYEIEEDDLDVSIQKIK